LNLTCGSIVGMKVSVSLPATDVAFLDEYATTHAFQSRSAVVHKAIDALRLGGLDDAYRDAWDEWTESGEADLWETTTSDGI
jgi:Arc/MetJ-type ribon-helix-helix transcriptional regulator